MKLKPVAKSLPLLSVLALAVLLASMAYTPALAATTVQHPRVWVEGTVTKDVYVGHSVFEYSTGELSEVLPFTRSDNLTIDFSRIAFEEPFINKTITTITASSEFGNAKADLLYDSYGVEYILLDMGTNTSNVAASTSYDAYFINEADLPVTNNYYILVTMKPQITAGADSISNVFAAVRLLFLDEAGQYKCIVLEFRQTSGTDTITAPATSTYQFGVTYDRILVQIHGVTDYRTYQAKIADILSAAGASWSLSKLVKISFTIGITTAATISDSSVGACAYFRHVMIVSDKVYIDDPGYDGGLVVNGTSGVLSTAAGDVINLYGAEAEKIVGLDIPFKYEPEPEIATAGSDGFTYKWEFMLPEQPSEGDDFTFSGTKMIMRSWFDGSYYDYLYVAGANKLSEINTLEVSEDTGYWEKELLTGLNPGYKYDVEAKVSGLPEDTFMELTAPAAWWNPKSWVYRILMFLYTLLSIFGIKATSVKKAAMRYRVPKTR